jgi:hypothetical protein
MSATANNTAYLGAPLGNPCYFVLRLDGVDTKQEP